MIVDHPFRPRYVYQNNIKVLLPGQCGFCIDQMLNAPAFDPVYCNAPAHEHMDKNTESTHSR